MHERKRAVAPSYVPDNKTSELSSGDYILEPARQVFSLALGIVSAIKDQRTRNEACLKIAQEQVLAGLRPIYPPDYFVLVAQQRESWDRESSYEGVVMLKAYMGDVKGALQIAELTSKFPWFQIEFVKVVAQKGGSTQPIFDEIHKRLVNGSVSDVRYTGYALEAQRLLGLTAPKHLLDQFRVRDQLRDNYSNSYNLELAEAYARAGYPQDALDVWQRTEDTGNHYAHKAAVLSHITISQARNGMNPSRLVEAAITYAEILEIKVDKKQIPNCLQAEIYINLGMAYAAYGLDPSLLIDFALQKASEIKDLDGMLLLAQIRADIYTQIAKAQIGFGADAKPTIAIALEWADNIVRSGEEEADSGFLASFQIQRWEEIFRVQLDGRFFDDARETLNRLDRYPDQDITALKAVLLAKLGRAQVEAATYYTITHKSDMV